ncbi:MAG: GNAT family N-acetyltransferase [Rhodospirillaceae bacterium]|jgi:ribosomal-protein-alanine N-acetyltransferase|nr:GNAT family N-acetyltransferase [Rhodospirillaceae bacterium]MBT3493238.1 GNAT family N-acetyltransferase [Rhodospirillaceae bacterium]MBT3782140.1 GNAT family N-acetyltransferase [Rhodospirillaceae bacterium]MBT3977659.1 GNAT family N-acetyltransferase [Rhodospirillaceae bacterium]MBT4167696.1 GNAT family N-acetyltransferase [Rhodospirillaceae bacterium]
MNATLETERLILRPFVAADLTALTPIYGDAAVMAIRKLGVQTPKQTDLELTAIIDHWARHGFGLWAVLDRQGGTLLGECGLRYRDPALAGDSEIEISYGLSKGAWGRGLATEASLVAMAHGFDVIGLTEIVAIAKASNRASHRVMEKLGMHLAETWERDGLGRVKYIVGANDFQKLAQQSN